MNISVVTAVYNRALQMERGLMTLISQKFKPYELVIVDDGTVDQGLTQAAVNRIEKKCKKRKINFQYIYLDHPEPRISCIPRNIGIRSATGDTIVFTESECLHVGETLEPLVNKLIQNPLRTPVATQIWTMGEKISNELSPEHFKDPSHILKHPYAQLTTSPNMINSKAPDSDWGITGSLNCITGCFFAVKKEDLLAIGGFDEDFEGHGWDDFDLFERLNIYGKPILACDDIAVIHQWHRKDYPYNIYDAAERNGTKSKDRVWNGEFRANIGKEWGIR